MKVLARAVAAVWGEREQSRLLVSTDEWRPRRLRAGAHVRALGVASTSRYKLEVVLQHGGIEREAGSWRLAYSYARTPGGTSML